MHKIIRLATLVFNRILEELEKKKKLKAQVLQERSTFYFRIVHVQEQGTDVDVHFHVETSLYSVITRIKLMMIF